MEPEVLSPRAVADYLGITTGELVELLRVGGYAWTELRPGRGPGLTGRPGWGLSRNQLQSIVDGQARRFTPPAEPASRFPGCPPGYIPTSPDGKSRLRRPRH